MSDCERVNGMLVPTSYEIMINEEQRQALLILVKREFPDSIPDDGHPLAWWVAMLEELPAEELDNPGVTHGFCL